MLKLKKYQQYILGLLASFAFILIGAAILAISLFSANRQQAASIKQISSELITAYTNPTEEVAPTEATQSTYLVTQVIDGDTIKLETGDTIRYIGIDAPETVDSKKGTECYGQQAADYNRQLVKDKQVTLEKDVSETDSFGRLLRYVYLDGTMINEKLVRDGYALISTYPPDVKYQDLFLSAQQEARENNRGLWTNCPVTSPAPTAD
jgi:micrococcal nuclease